MIYVCIFTNILNLIACIEKKMDSFNEVIIDRRRISFEEEVERDNLYELFLCLMVKERGERTL